MKWKHSSKIIQNPPKLVFSTWGSRSCDAPILGAPCRCAAICVTSSADQVNGMGIGDGDAMIREGFGSSFSLFGASRMELPPLMADFAGGAGMLSHKMSQLVESQVANEGLAPFRSMLSGMGSSLSIRNFACSALRIWSNWHIWYETCAQETQRTWRRYSYQGKFYL